MGKVRKTVCAPVHRLLNLIDPPVIVLIYHRVTTLPSDPEMLAVTPENFRAQMRHLKDSFPIVRFEENWAESAKPAVCVTFDDGYADNALEALPILEELGVPATFFVTTELIGAARYLWWHELEELLLGDTAVPSHFALEEGGQDICWATGTASERLQLYQDLVRLMNDSEPGSRETWLQQLRSWTGGPRQGAQTHRGMTLTELRTLAESSWATVGAHTVTHSRLSALSDAEQRDEITASKQQLEAWLDREVTVFSYPFGRRSDFTRESMALCRQAGFSKVAANFPGPVHRWTDPCRIPRHLVRNWPVGQFVEKLRGFWVR